MPEPRLQVSPVRRAVDAIVHAVALVVCSPILLVLAILSRIERGRR